MQEVLGSLALILDFVLWNLLWLIIGRYALRILVGGKTNFFTALLQRVTDPWFRLVRLLTPGSISDRHIPILGLLLVVNLRLFLMPVLLARL